MHRKAEELPIPGVSAATTTQRGAGWAREDPANVCGRRIRCAARLDQSATKAVTDVDFGLSGLTPQEETQLTTLLSQVRHAAGDFTARPDPAGDAGGDLFDDEASADLA